MRTSLAVQPHLYIGDSTGRPLDYGMVYFGQVDKDPEFYPIAIFYDEALTIAASQPVRSKGGFLNANGDMVEIYAAEIEYSVKVLDSRGVLVFYERRMKRATVGSSIIFKPDYDGAIERTLADKNSDFIDIRDFVNPGDSDHTAGLQAAAAAALSSKKKLTGAGTYYIESSDVSFRYLELDLGSCTFMVTKPYKIIMGGDASTGLNPNQVIGNVRNPAYSYDLDSITYPTIQVMGAKNQYIKVGFVQYIQFYQSTNPATFPKDASQAYSTFDISFAIKLSVDTDPAYATGEQADGSGSANQWFNENTINLNRCYGFYMRGSYPHNHNIINGGSFEGVSKIRLEVGNKNHFKRVRFEGSSNSVYFGDSTIGNTIEKTWFGSQSNFWIPPATTDLGQLNSIRTIYDSQAQKRLVLAIADTDTVYNGVVDAQYKRAASAKYIKSLTAAYSVIASSKLFAIKSKDYIFSRLSGEANAFYLLRIYVYDANKQPITNLTDIKVETSLTASASNNYYDSGFSSVARFASLDSTIKYVRVDILAVNDLKKQTAREIEVFISSLRPMTEQSIAPIGMSASQAVVKIKPTQFVGRIGDAMQSVDGARYVCAHMLYTTLTAASSGANISVADFYNADSGSTLVGDLVGVELNNGIVHWSTVSAISSNSVTLSSALPSAAASGNVVYISRLV